VLWANVAGIFALAATVFTALAIGVWLIGQVVGTGLTLWQLLVISVGSGLAIAAIAVIASVVATYSSYRLGVDPDDTTIPIVTNVVDVFGMIVFLAVARLVLGG
jgi:mgtE-like transporter